MGSPHFSGPFFLLVNQPDIGVKAWALGRPRAHVIGEDCTTADVAVFMSTTRKWCHSLYSGSFLLGASESVLKPRCTVYLDQGRPTQYWWAGSLPGWALALCPARMSTAEYLTCIRLSTFSRLKGQDLLLGSICFARRSGRTAGTRYRSTAPTGRDRQTRKTFLITQCISIIL